MKKFILITVLFFLVGCNQKKEFLGVVTAFELSGGGFLTGPHVKITTSTGGVYSERLYKDIAVGDSLWRGDLGLVWGPVR